MDDEKNVYVITYDGGPIYYKPLDNSAFCFCCSEDDSFDCLGDQPSSAEHWMLLPMESVYQSSESTITVTVQMCNTFLKS